MSNEYEPENPEEALSDLEALAQEHDGVLAFLPRGERVEPVIVCVVPDEDDERLPIALRLYYVGERDRANESVLMRRGDWDKLVESARG